KAIGISLEVYPNPSFGKAVIRYTCPFSVSGHEPRTRITIHDLSGKLVKQVLTAKQGVEINLEELTNGIYFVRVEVPPSRDFASSTDDFKAVKKLVLLR
ncbi:T9SS type A sorting domain-containing protein, partial [candidate division WOR-3 bacterium]|nr:T9SS type A sorting domain-containing protein [candidate division WOR-3 bacterium]